ncbi:MAG: tRNA (adenosine(37)-N6)-threonylcarbamoyltransferase complex ATPase subunit type 1 TsaE [Candidatus Aminicenantes bacterium]|nr:tRNA (adenosine(37)-N6)-threonylcarbamoyltransferase complex ATPase subunit type 1 TsaE [Candidatus Aminicenantes bacterium]
MDFTLLSSAPENTLACGRQLGLQLRGQEIILVSGDLGAGKTVFIKGIASGLGIPVQEVVSPSYVLMNQYEGIHPLFHFDLYRLGGLLGARENPIDEFIGAGVVAVEWAQFVRPDYFSLTGVIAVDIATLADSRRQLRLRTELSHIVFS